MGENEASRHLSEFSLYVGYDQDYVNNTPCAGSPFLPYDASTYGTYATYGGQTGGSDWPNGVEAWCNLPGDYVSFVRESTANPPLSEVVLCTFGVIATSTVDPCVFQEMTNEVW